MTTRERLDAVHRQLAEMGDQIDRGLARARADLDDAREALGVEGDPIPEPGDMVAGIQVGDWIKITGYDKYHEVLGGVEGSGLPVVDLEEQAEACILPEAIEDIYTKAEQEANGALVQVGENDRWVVRLATGLDGVLQKWVPNTEGTTGILSAEAAAALGEFQPVPDRAIVAGDVVRWGADSKAVFVVTAVIHAGGREWANGFGNAIRLDALSLVAPEDQAYREAKEQSQQQILSDIATGAAFECSGDRDCLAKDHEDECQYDPGYEAEERGGCTCPEHTGCVCYTEPDPAPEAKEREPHFDGSCDPHPDDSWVSGSSDDYPALNQGLFPGWERSPKCIHDSESCCSECRPAEPNPAPEVEEPHEWQPTTNTLAVWRCAKCDDIVFDPHPLPKTGCEPDPAPSIPESWDLITAGEVVFCYLGEHEYREIESGIVWFEAKVFELGPVRRCIPVTLPDLDQLETTPFARATSVGNVVIRAAAINERPYSPATARQIAAELLAAAIKAEEEKL